nr:alpha/beta hydrolase [Sansalvadorimonas sp. 2012CJ34-2]
MSTSLWDEPADPSVTSHDETIEDNLTIRWYSSAGSNERGLVFFHGGGMMLGDLQSHDQFCRRLAARRSMAVVAVNYRLAPENPFPAGVEDAIRAWNHIVEIWKSRNKDMRQLGIGGDSAGGYLATLVCQQAIKSGLSVKPVAMPAWQWLLYPVTDLTDNISESWRVYSHDLPLTNRMMHRFIESYAEREQLALPEVSPALADSEVLAQMPATAVITAEFDPLKDQGIRYARLLKSAGVSVVQRHEAKLPHAFIHFSRISSGAKLGIEKAISIIDQICLQARRTLPGQIEKVEEETT